MSGVRPGAMWFAGLLMRWSKWRPSEKAGATSVTIPFFDGPEDVHPGIRNNLKQSTDKFTMANTCVNHEQGIMQQ